MKRIKLLLVFMFLPALLVAQKPNEYIVVAGKSVKNDPAWNAVAEALVKKHGAEILYYDNHPKELIGQIRIVHPRYMAVVEKPGNLDIQFVMDMHRFTRKIDDDIYSDCLWGIISGYDAGYAMKMVANSTALYVIRTALNTTGESSTGNLYEKFAWIDDGKKYMWGEKLSVRDSVKRYEVDQWTHLRTFVHKYEELDPDLIVTSAHATETNLEMPYSVGDIMAKDGRLYADFCVPYYLPQTEHPRVYFAAGNCLIGNMNRTDQSMCCAWLSGGGATSMIGYVVPTWYGRGGWGTLKYWMSNPSRLTLAEAFYLNMMEMVYIMNKWDGRFSSVEPQFGTGEYKNDVNYDAGEAFGRKLSKDETGFLHDRDVVAFYGDPKWDVKVRDVYAKPGYTTSFSKKGDRYVITVKTNNNLDNRLIKGNNLKQVHVNDIPFAYVFPQRIANPTLAEGQDWGEVCMDENAILIYKCEFERNKTYKIIIESK